VDYYGTQQGACPQCGSTADVRTVQDLVAMMSGQAPGNPMPGPGQNQQYGSGPEPGPYAQPWYGPESGYGSGPGPTSTRDEYRQDSADQEIADLVIGLAGRFIGKAIKNKMQKVAEQRVMPTLNARAEQQRQEMVAIAQRYPELSACLRDQVIFLAGGTRTVPLSQVNMSQVTLAQADALVAQLRQP
jgi:hypothetical protein